MMDEKTRAALTEVVECAQSDEYAGSTKLTRAVQAGVEMDKDTLKALKGSIKKWKDIAAGDEGDRGPDNCPLCTMFFWKDKCEGCPVSASTDRTGCENTPYEEWDKHHETKHDQMVGIRDVECPECKEIALKEVAFLESLLPEKKDG